MAGKSKIKTASAKKNRSPTMETPGNRPATIAGFPSQQKCPAAPAALDDAARDYWGSLAPLVWQRGALVDANAVHFGELCRVLVHLDELNRIVSEHGHVDGEGKRTEASRALATFEGVAESYAKLFSLHKRIEVAGPEKENKLSRFLAPEIAAEWRQ